MEGEDEESDDERAFNNQPAFAKAVIIVAGAAMNVITAVILMTIVVFVSGTPTTTIDSVLDDSPAQMAGLKSGDKIIQVDDTVIDDWSQFTAYVDGREGGDNITITVERDGTEKKITAEVEKLESGDKYIGVNSRPEKYQLNALIEGPKATWDMGKNMLKILSDLFSGNVQVKDLSGPVGIVYMVDKSVAEGMITFIYFMALISLNLAVVNMLPFPALDGGRLIFIIIRKITGKAITDNIEGMVHLAGMVCLLALMLYVTWQDILRFILPIFK